MKIRFMLGLLAVGAIQGCLSSSSDERKSDLPSGVDKTTVQEVQMLELSEGEIPDFEFLDDQGEAIYSSNELTLLETNNKSFTPKPWIVPDKASQTVSALAYNPGYVQFSGCVKIEHNQAYSYTPSPGNSICLYVDVAESAITEFFAIDQNANRQVNITVIDDPNADLNLVGVQQSQDTDSDDNIRIYTESGHYYMLVSGVSGDGGSIRVGAAVNTNRVDDLENIGSSPSYNGNNTTPYTFANGNLEGHFASLYDGNDIDLYQIQFFWGARYCCSHHAKSRV